LALNSRREKHSGNFYTSARFPARERRLVSDNRTFSVSVAAGLGANVLVGGSNQSVALQPLSVQGQLGFDIAGGIGALELHPAR
jgi:hypothetical protein